MEFEDRLYLERRLDTARDALTNLTLLLFVESMLIVVYIVYKYSKSVWAVGIIISMVLFDMYILSIQLDLNADTGSSLAFRHAHNDIHDNFPHGIQKEHFPNRTSTQLKNRAFLTGIPEKRQRDIQYIQGDIPRPKIAPALWKSLRDLSNLAGSSNIQSSREKGWVHLTDGNSYHKRPFKRTPVILSWTLHIHMNRSVGWDAGREYMRRTICPVYDCLYTSDTARYLEADVLLFSQMDFHPEYHKFPPHRLPHQRYVFLNRESPLQPWISRVTRNTTFTRNFYNWTATYRPDSDIFTPYVFFYPDPQPSKVAKPSSVMKDKIKGKNYIAWFVSHCKTPSRREEYVKELQKYIPVDIYGKCGPMKCNKPMEKSCYKMLSNYWFYLSFENSLCKDYVTEKILFPMVYAHVVPIVYGAANYKQILPPNSFLNIMDFKSPKVLAEFLIELTQDESRYMSYFAWKGSYTSIYAPNILCEICDRLHNPQEPGKVYSNFTAWWNQDQCNSNWIADNAANW